MFTQDILFFQLANFSWSIWAFTMARDPDQDFDYVGQVILNRGVMVMVFNDNISILGGDILNRWATLFKTADIHLYTEKWLIDFWCLMPLSAIFQLYHGDQCWWWKKPGYPEKTGDHGQATGKLYHLRLRVQCTLFCNLQSRARTHAVLVIGLY